MRAILKCIVKNSIRQVPYFTELIFLLDAYDELKEEVKPAKITPHEPLIATRRCCSETSS